MNHAKNHGFTIIELMLAMTFVSILLIAVAVTAIQISNIYNKGVTLREVNQLGRSVSDELQRSIASSVPFDVTPGEAGSKYVVRDGGGRLCLGNYTYAWNYGKALAGGTDAPAVFNTYSDITPVRFVKVADASGSLCADPTLNIERSKASDMLSGGDRDLVIHSFTISQTAGDPNTNQAIYAISMLIGTNDREQLAANDASCRPPSEGVGNENYCSVNQFDIIARAGNKAGGE